MAILPILCYPDPRLHKVAQPIQSVDDRVRSLASDMLATMYDAHGIGLAATQVDVHERLVVIDVSEERNEPLVLINPEIVWASAEKHLNDEGCLSVPGIYDGVERFDAVHVRALDAQGSEAYVIASHKTRFPTIKDRYSARMGASLPNPDLKPEVANHLELGVKGAPWTGGRGQAALFYSRITDLMQNVNVAAPVGTCGVGSRICAQAQNVGRARNSGLELSLEQTLGSRWTLGGAYTYLVRRNLSDASITLTDTPSHRLYAFLNWAPSDRWQLRTTLEAEQGRKVAFAGGGKNKYRDEAGFGMAGGGRRAPAGADRTCRS